jgi:hypothetical protein
MTPTLAHPDTICDLKGEPLHPNAVILLKALDRLLTVGAYYSADHDQYLQAARKARDAIVGVIGSARNSVAIEITSQGLMVNRQNVDPNHRNVRLLHDLLVPLNIARFEIDGSLTPEDLRQAIAALQEHKLVLGQSHSFQEIVIENLPSSVRTSSRSVFDRSPDSAETSLSDLLGNRDAPPAHTDPAPQKDTPEQLARQFMEMVTEILTNLERADHDAGEAHLNDELKSRVTPTELAQLKAALRRLVEVNPDPAELAELITQAQRALELSRDPHSVDLAFKVLKRNLAEPGTGKARQQRAPEGPAVFKLSVADMMSAVAALEKSGTPVDEPWVGSRVNQLGIALHLLRSDPPRALRSALIEVVEGAVVQPDFVKRHLWVCTEAAADVAREDGVEGVDDLLPVVTGSMRRKQAEFLALFWVQLLESIGADHLVELWPHLVNDILRGFDNTEPEAVLKLVEYAGDLSPLTAMSLGPRLEKQPALHGKTAAPDLFVAPLPRIFPVLTMLLASPLRDWLGKRLFRALRAKPISPLVDVVLAALGEHRPENSAFYLDLIQHDGAADLPLEVRNSAAAILHQAVSGLAPEERQAEWVPRSLGELWTLDPERTRPLLKHICRERKLFFFKAWPAPVRRAAARVLASDPQEDS